MGPVDGPVIEKSVFEKTFDDITGFFAPNWRYGAIECQGEDYGVVDKGDPCGGGGKCASVIQERVCQIQKVISEVSTYMAGSKTILHAEYIVVRWDYGGREERKQTVNA